MMHERQEEEMADEISRMMHEERCECEYGIADPSEPKLHPDVVRPLNESALHPPDSRTPQPHSLSLDTPTVFTLQQFHEEYDLGG